MNGLIIKAVLRHFTDGNTGSTYLGVLAAALLSANVSWGDLASHDPARAAQAWGLVIAVAAIVTWGWFTGKRSKAEAIAEAKDVQTNKGDL